MASSVVVLCPNARRQTVKVTPNTTILQILEHACEKTKLDPQEFDLINQRKILDVSLTVRFANLSNNALLEMRPTQRERKESQVTVVLQTELGERLMHEFSPTSSLWDIITHWIHDRGEAFLRGESSQGADPVCLYMRREVVGEAALREATLRSLGLTSGKAMIRLFYRDSETLKTQAFVESIQIKPLTENISTDNNVEVRDLNLSLEPLNTELKDITNEVSQVSVAIDSQVTIKEPEDVKIEEVLDQPMLPEKIKSHTIQSSWNEPRYSSDASTSKESTIISSELSSAESEADEEDVKIIFIGDRDAVLYDAKSTSSQFIENLPDDFFELTVEDARYLYSTLQKQRRVLEDKTLSVSSYKMAKNIETMLRFKYTILRIQFPDQQVIQAKFNTTEKVSCVMTFLRQFLQDESLEFQLFITPPRTTLSPELTLYEAELVPASLVHFSCNQSPEKILKAELRSQISSHKAACQAAANIRKSSRLNDGISIGVVCPLQPAPTPVVQAVSRQQEEPFVQPGSTSIPSKKPKWFTMGPK